MKFTECDRNFTRSDALTKHMRSVHEIDSLKSADTKSNVGATPGPSAGTPASKLQRIRLKLSTPRESDGLHPTHPDAIISAASAAEATDPDDMTMPELGPELGFDEHELSLDPRELYRLLRRQIFWAERESVKLRAEWEETRPKRENAWRQKNHVFDSLNDGELRLFSAIVGSGDNSSSTESADLSTTLEKLQQQHQKFRRQQDELTAKETEKEDEAAQVEVDMEAEPPAATA